MSGFSMADCFDTSFIQDLSFIMVTMTDGCGWPGIVVYMCVCLFWYLINFYGDVLFPLFFWYSFCPSDSKFATCSDDGTVRIWDFMKCHEEKILRGMLGYRWTST